MTLDDKPLLLRVAEACNDHQNFHKDRPYDEIIPKECQTAQLGLQKTLPRAEKEYGAAANPHPLDVLHLCDFYRNVLSGVFCPHAPYLFDWGRDGVKVFPRVICLYEHLGSKQMLQLATKQEVQGSEEGLVVEKICTTIAHLLNFIPKIQPTVLRDLINFTFDLGVVSEAKLLESSDNVDISIFCESSGQNYCLKIRNEESLVLLQHSTYKIIHILLNLQLIKQTEAPSYIDHPKEVPLEGPFDHLNCVWGHVLSDGALLADVVTSCRQIFLSDPPESDIMWSLTMDAKISAISLLNEFLEDQTGLMVSCSTLPSSLALMLSQSVAAFLNMAQNCPDVACLTVKRDILASGLTEAMRSLLISPAYGNEIVHEIRFDAISALIESLLPMSRISKKDNLLDLCRTILVSIHLSLSMASPYSKELVIAQTSAALFSVNGVMSALLALFKDWSLSREAFIVFNRLLLAETSQSFDQGEIRIACFAAWSEFSTEVDMAADFQGSSEPDCIPHQDRKRKQLISPKKSTRATTLTQSLIMRQSPKRQRVDGYVATPSPAGVGASGSEIATMSSEFIPQTLSTLDAITSSLCETLECAQRISSLENNLALEGNRTGATSTEELCLIVSMSTVLACHIERYLNSESKCRNSATFRQLFPEVDYVFNALSTAIQCTAQSLSSKFQATDPCKIDPSNQLLLVADILVSTALFIHFEICEVSASVFSDMFVHHISQIAWQMWRNYHNSSVMISNVMKPRANISLEQKRHAYHPGHQGKPLNTLKLLSETNLLERIGLLACIKPTPLQGTSMEDMFSQCRNCLLQLFGNFGALHDIAKASVLQLTPVLLLSISDRLFIKDADILLRRHLSYELLDIIPLQCLIEMASSCNGKRFVQLLAVEALYHLQTFLVADLPSISSCQSICHLIHSVRNNMTKTGCKEETRPQSDSRGKSSEVTMEILHMTLPSIDNFGSAQRLATWNLFNKASQSTNLIDLLIPNDCKEDIYSHVTSKPSRTEYVSLVWLFETPFVDPDPLVRKQTAPLLGRVLLRNSATILCALFANERERDLLADKVNTPKGESVAVAVIARVFHAIDRLMFKFCLVPQSQLTSTMAHTVTADFTGLSVSESLRNQQHDATIDFQYCAIKVLSSLCRNVDPSAFFGRLVFEYSFVRLLRFWTSSDNHLRVVDVSHGLNVSIASLAYHAIIEIHSDYEVGHLLEQHGKEIYASILFVDLLFPCTSCLVTENSGVNDPVGREVRKHQYQTLYAFIESFLLSRPLVFSPSKNEGVDYASSTCDVSAFFDEAFRFVFPTLILEKDYDTLRLATGFNLFLLHKRKQAEKMQELDCDGPRDNIVGMPIGPLTKIRGVDADRSLLEEQTKLLCLHPTNIGMILPRLLACDIADRRSSPLLFFLDIVIKRTVQLREMVQFESSRLLGNILWELCINDEMELHAIQAIRSAAATLDQPPGSLLSDLAGRWVSRNFMSLTVNIVQQKWKSRSMDERIRALRCLKIMLRFLLPTEAPQFIPQMLATVNMAISDEATNGTKLSVLRLFAVQALSQYLRLWAEGQSETLGQNLTTVVVSLFPTIPLSASATSSNPSAGEASRVAIDLLEWLSSGTLGEKLAVYFKDIPFLPQSPSLDKVRDSLQSLGVDFNNSFIMTSTQGARGRDSIISDSGESVHKSFGKAAAVNSIQAQKSLQRRISILCPLFEHQSSSVRKVALVYLTNLLRANRCLFYQLVEIEEKSPTALYLTLTYDHEASGVTGKNFIKGRVALMIETLLRRCGAEDDEQAQLYLATSLGEIGAIDGNRLGEISVRHDRSGLAELSRSWQLTQPPWKSSPTRYELQLVTKQLVGALQAAPDSTDLDKIAFTIQQLLGNLDKGGKGGGDNVGHASHLDGIGDFQDTTINNERGEMSQWLREQLVNAEVLEMMEPFWASKYKEASSKARAKFSPPPFFQYSSSYFMWLSNFCRYMIRRSKTSGHNQWTDFFFACRTAIRSSAGLAIAEFILPLLILDRLCSDIKEVEDFIHAELKEVLCQHIQKGDDNASTVNRMNQGDKQKAISAVFSILDTFQWWAENEIEDRHRSNTRYTTSSSRSISLLSERSSTWSAVESLGKIDALTDAIPLELRAQAATSVGMHARALQCLEMAARANRAHDVFDSPTQTRSAVEVAACPRKWHIIDGLDTIFLKKVLANLDDFDTISGIPKPEMEVFGEDSIIEKEARGDFEGAYNDYERCLQLESSPQKRSKLEEGALRCLIELGQFENVLNQVKGIMKRSEVKGKMYSEESLHATPFAVEAGWKLGRWSELDELVKTETRVGDGTNTNAIYHISLGKVMLGLHQRSQQLVDVSIGSGRRAILSMLSNMSRESYTRAYPFLVRLHCLREIQDASEFLVDQGQSLSELAHSPTEFDWNDRLDVVSSLKCSTIIDVRSALARLANDAALEGSLHLLRGIKARKNGLYKIATNSFAKAISSAFQKDRAMDKTSRIELADFMGSIQLQLAKLQHNMGECGAAIRILGDDDVRGWLDVGEGQARTFALERDALHISRLLKTNGHDVANSDRFAKRLLQSTQWMVEGGLKGVSELTERFRVAHALAPKWERGHFQFAKYIDVILETRLMALATRDFDRLNSIEAGSNRSIAVFQDDTCQTYLKLAMQQYIEALKLGEKHVYLALPRLLSLWFEFTGIPGGEIGKMMALTKEKKSMDDKTGRKQPDIKDIVGSMQGEINVIMSEATRTIPAQSFYTAMPQMISRVNHGNNETALVVHGILSRVLMKFPGQALWALTWLRNSANKERAMIGDFIFKNAQDGLLKRKQKKYQKMLLSSQKLVKFFIDLAKYKPSEPTASQFTIRPWSGEVDLIDFVPPVQAALSTAQDQERISDMFPRMRAIKPQVAVMSSKARPKRVRIFMVPGGRKQRINTESGKREQDDIGELHFLVKNEEKGDLRKDARVQDLNNVVNRLLSNSSKGSQNRRRLNLRTFAVTCLSEDCGILEWVPNTESFRGLVLKTYNPQAMPTSHRRRGKRLGNFGDISLRQAFDKCQAMYFKNGNLTKAAAMFDDLCLRNYPPLFYWWFVQNFIDPHSWYDARTRFTHSAAVWSALGHVIGLGDRHSENILIDTCTGACVHVDFDCIFDKGLTLPKPEVIPFRLTSNMLDAFGPVGADGVFASSLKMAMGTLRDNRDTLLSVLEPFLKDPIIDWKAQRSQQKQGTAGTSAKESQDARKSMQIIEERLRGIYNLRNPNHKKIARTDRVSSSEDDDMMHLLPLSVEGQVQKMILEATSSENLLQCYIGWMPWI